ncbi:MAG TPA: VRR-NUC domain-containing protein [Pseudonocardia sp.]
MSARLTAADQLLRGITETQWQTRVENIAEFYGWMHYHAPNNVPRQAKSGRKFVQNVRAGWPDLALLHPARSLFLVAELKTETGRISDDQAEWLSGFRSAGIRAEVWRPRDLDTVTAILGPAAAGWAEWSARAEVTSR